MVVWRRSTATTSARLATSTGRLAAPTANALAAAGCRLVLTFPLSLLASGRLPRVAVRSPPTRRSAVVVCSRTAAAAGDVDHASNDVVGVLSEVNVVDRMAVLELRAGVDVVVVVEVDWNRGQVVDLPLTRCAATVDRPPPPCDADEFVWNRLPPPPPPPPPEPRHVRVDVVQAAIRRRVAGKPNCIAAAAAAVADDDEVVFLNDAINSGDN